MFKNAIVYRLPAGWEVSAAMLAAKTFNACGTQDQQSSGFVAPRADAELSHPVGGYRLFCHQVETRLLPSAVVQEHTEERVAAVHDQQGYRPGRKQTKEIREAVIQELLPKAFTTKRRTYGWVDPAGYLVIDASSTAKAEDVLEDLRRALESFPLALLRTERSPASAMSDWLASGEAPSGFTVDQECELVACTDDKAAVRYLRHPLEGEEVKQHLEAGKLPTRLAMTFDDRVSFVLTEKLELRKLDLLDVVKEKAALADVEGRNELFDAEFVLWASELNRLFAGVVEVLGGEMRQEQGDGAAGEEGAR